MTLTLVFSVPLIHLAAALSGDLQRPVAFATDVMETFTNAADEQFIERGTPVVIYASQPQTDPRSAALFRAGAMVAGGDFYRWQRANKLGRHPNPELRPVTTDTDGPVCGFIEVVGLHRLETPLKFADLRKVGGQKLAANFVPRRPRLLQTLPALKPGGV